MLSSLFNSNKLKELEAKNRQLETLNLQLKSELLQVKEEYLKKEHEFMEREKELEKRKNELDDEFKVIKIREKQMDILEKNLKELHADNVVLKESESRLKETSLDGDLPLEKQRYKISVERYYSGAKFKETLQELKNREIAYLNDMSEEILENIFQDNPLKEEIIRRFVEFKNGKFEIEIKILALKGEKINKVYSKLRKFTTYMDSILFEYMNDLRDFNFLQLSENGFKKDQIEDLKNRAEEYFEKNIIKEND